MSKKQLHPLTSQYMETGIVFQLINSTPNDQELGELIRSYAQQCSERAKNDEVFPITATLVEIGASPSAIKNQFKNKLKSE